MTEGGVLIVSTVADVATDAVIDVLRRRGVPHYRINTEDFPFQGTFTLRFPDADAWFGGKAIAPQSVWYRRVRSPTRLPDMEVGIYDFCLRENRAAFMGGLLALDSRWMSHPAAVWQAEFKPYQLREAAAVGLTIPRTFVSNDPDEIRRAHAAFGPLVVKAVSSGTLDRGDRSFAIYTSLLTDEYLAHIEEARLAPSIYQALIPKRCDVRVTCVGDRFFAAAIDSQSDAAARIDWRRTVCPELPHSRIELPSTIETKLRALMRRLGLTFGCIDLVQTPDSDFVFLEVNPSGQWLWIDDRLELGISQAVAGWLSGETL
jgi:glutathione synthase/RimK-type ligase-like ATP-grasp enzyme